MYFLWCPNLCIFNGAQLQLTCNCQIFLLDTTDCCTALHFLQQAGSNKLLKSSATVTIVGETCMPVNRFLREMSSKEVIGVLGSLPLTLCLVGALPVVLCDTLWNLLKGYIHRPQNSYFSRLLMTQGPFSVCILHQ